MALTPSIDVYRDLIAPMGERIRADERFYQLKNVLYDYMEELPFSEMPALIYFVQSPWEDVARGSGSYTLQTRRMVVRIMFNLWLYNPDKQQMTEELCWQGGLLMDFIRDFTDFDQPKGVGLRHESPLVWMLHTERASEGYVGMHSITAEYDIYSGSGR
jgi:hypothetical protein